jgi:hypothetical protein
MGMNWRKASYSSGSSGNCVEAASGGGAVLVRDTASREGLTLEVPAAAWATFVTGLK